MSENDVLPYATFIAIATMAAMTYLVRVGGFWMMGHVTITPRVHRMLDALPGSVVAAIILPVVAKNGLPALCRRHRGDRRDDGAAQRLHRHRRRARGRGARAPCRFVRTGLKVSPPWSVHAEKCRQRRK